MEHNEISMCMDVKLDTHDKRPVAMRYKTWTRCEVKIEAIKCVPCFLRLSFQPTPDTEGPVKTLSISVNVPGVSLSLATSRTKQYSYGLFWTQNRRDCFIYFALETETACRKHMKWVRKSVKNLELYRQVFLEQRRLSRGPQGVLGPLPNLPEILDASSMSARVSQIYEEIFDGSRISRVSIASGIYEEMKPAVLEAPSPPPLPVQPHRKRINTFESQAQEIPRANTNPESELAKRKKYKNMLDTLFGGVRQKRSGSVSESVKEPEENQLPLYENAPTPEPVLPLKRSSQLSRSQRNSFSSPDLSKLNILDALEADSDGLNFGSSVELNISLDESVIEPSTSRMHLVSQIARHLVKADSLESLNVSEQLPHNFNFSACNTSTINLIGSHGAVMHNTILKKNKIIVDDLTGYCVMAPIVKGVEKGAPPQPGGSTASTSSGYSTGSYCSSTSSCNTEDQPARTLVAPGANESGIYEAMHGNSLNSTVGAAANGFAEHLYENLLAVKAAQELEAQPIAFGLSTSTPTESPLAPALPQKGTPKEKSLQQPEEEDYYQTPRKSIISVDDKIPSYYPNSCDTIKSKRRSPTDYGPSLRHLASSKLRRERKENLYISSPQQILDQRHKVYHPPSTSTPPTKTKISTKKTAAHKISDGVYSVTHPVKRPSSVNSTSSNNNNNLEGAEDELLHLTMLKNIDFKFDDGHAPADDQAEKKQPTTNVGIMQPEVEEEYEDRYQAAEKATQLLQKYATLAKLVQSPKKAKAVVVNMEPMAQSVAPTSNELQSTGGGMKKFASLPRFKKIDFSPLKMRLNNVLQRNSPSPQQ
ncbi:hypothetical protein KR067_011327 [Drosophila pandora]|nr:hypothetical protein KR067_011327 [Drosophila pandora]